MAVRGVEVRVHIRRGTLLLLVVPRVMPVVQRGHEHRFSSISLLHLYVYFCEPFPSLQPDTDQHYTALATRDSRTPIIASLAGSHSMRYARNRIPRREATYTCPNHGRRERRGGASCGPPGQCLLGRVVQAEQWQIYPRCGRPPLRELHAPPHFLVGPLLLR